MTKFQDSTLLVTGAGGNLGRIVVDELLARGARKIIAGTRDTSSLSELADKGVEVRRIDFDDADLASALTGVDRMLLISTVAPNRREHQRQAVEAAKSAGVKHIVYTSSPNPRPNSSVGGIADHYWTEQAIAATGLDFTLLRNHIYTDMTLAGLDAVKATGQLFDATGTGGRNYVTRADAARAAAGALLDSEGQNIFDVTGPAPVLQEDVAVALQRLAGRAVTRVGLSGDQLRGGLIDAGIPPFMADLLVAFDVDAAFGYHAIATDTVERFSGRKPTSLSEFLAAQE
jgi:NAD(P)H dehydrogenase (quinone)